MTNAIKRERERRTEIKGGGRRETRQKDANEKGKKGGKGRKGKEERGENRKRARMILLATHAARIGEKER